MTRDLRLLPAAALAWLGVLAVLRGGALVAAGIALATLATAAAALARLHRDPGGRHRARTVGRAAATVALSAVAIGALVGWAAARAELRAAAVAEHLRTTADVVLRVQSEPRELATDRWLVQARWLVTTTGAGEPRRVDVPVVVLAGGEWSAVVVGAEVAATVRVAPSEPGDAAAALLVGEGDPEVVARPPPVAAAVAALRDGLRAACATLSPQAQGLVPGIAVGDDRALPPALEDDLRAVSLTHVTAVSGAHVAMVLGLVVAALARAPTPVRAVAAGLVLCGLVVLVHPTASVVRAAAMGGVLLVGLLSRRPRAALPALWTSVLVLLAVDPWLSSSFGFVLSVLATAGLLLASGPLADRLAQWLPRTLALALAVPLAAQLACLPALALLQPAAPVHGVTANVLAAPAVPVATVLGLVATLVHPLLPHVAEVVAAAAGVSTAWIAAVATWCADLPLTSVPWWLVVVGLAAAGLARSSAGRRLLRRAAAGAVRRRRRSVAG